MRLCQTEYCKRHQVGRPSVRTRAEPFPHWHAAACCGVLQSRLVAACLADQAVLFYSPLLDSVTGLDKKPVREQVGPISAMTLRDLRKQLGPEGAR